MLSPITSTLAVLSLLSSFTQALPTPSPEFDDILLLSPRELVPAYVDKRDVPDYTAPKGLKQSIAYFPAISSPEEGSVWKAGSSLTVAWNNTVPDYAPNQIHNYATLLLGFRNEDDPASGLNLDVDHPLANVSLYGTADPIQVQLPSDLPTRSTYLLVLGSTANMSPLFTIEGTDTESSSSSPSSSSSKGAMSTRTIVAAPSPSPSSSPEEQQQPVAITSTKATPVSSSSEAAAARLAPPSQSVSPSEDSSPSPKTAASSTTVRAQSQAPSSSFQAQNAATPISASGGALAASSSTPTSGSASLSSSAISIFAGGLFALVCMI
ncbi:hypothetical protein JCM3765_003981 [Sporobolomyces pararoseus]